MKQFISCICDDNLNELIISGQPTAEQLAEAWANIFLEYCDLAELAEVRYKALLRHDTEILKAQIETAKSCIQGIRICIENNIAPLPGFISALNYAGFEHEYLPETIEKDIARVEAELIPMEIRLEGKVIELNILSDNSTQSDKVERKYFHTIFLRLNTYFKHEAVNMQSTVQEYCAALRDYVAAAKESVK